MKLTVTNFKNELAIDLSQDEFEKICLMEYERSEDKKVEYLFDEKGNFCGHYWDWNCVYTESDLQRNGQYVPADDWEFEQLQEKIKDYIEQFYV